MIEKYNPDSFRCNKHIVKITFNKNGYTGHISTKIGGNCKGSTILGTAIDFLEECNKDDIKKLIKNDCSLKLHSDGDEYWFSLDLCNENNDTLSFDDIDVQDLQNMIVGVEIVACEPENE